MEVEGAKREAGRIGARRRRRCADPACQRRVPQSWGASGRGPIGGWLARARCV